MDDTIENLLVAWVDILNERYGTHVSANEVHDWSMPQFFPSLTEKQVYAPLYEDTFWDKVKPIPGANVYLKRLIDDGHNVYIVTSSNYQTLKAKMEKVLFRFFPMIDWNHVIVTSNKQMIRGDVLVDDGLHNHVGGKYLKILMDAPHNRNINASKHGIIRVKSWAGVYRVVYDYAMTPWTIDTIFGLKGTRNTYRKKDISTR